MLTTEGDAPLKTAMLFCSSAVSGPRGAMGRGGASVRATAVNVPANRTALTRRERGEGRGMVSVRASGVRRPC